MDTKTFKILLVDDEPDILEILSYPLKNEGFQVHTANNGLEAIKLAKDIQPHLIVLDVMMPEMDGIEACEIIRKDPKISNTLITFLSARGEDYSKIAGFNAGADDYIHFVYKVEAQDLANSGWNYTSSSSNITLSFWVKASVAQNYYGYLLKADGSTRSFAF